MGQAGTHDGGTLSRAERWARFRFSVIGPLLSSPPERGELRAELARVAARSYQHPISGAAVCIGLSTVERWYYAARDVADPLRVLRNRVRKDAGEHPSVGLLLRDAIRAQHHQHPSWSYQLHYDNLAAQAGSRPELKPLPSYAVVRRWMKSQGLFRRKRIRARHTAGALIAEQRLERLEVRSYEAEFVGALFHADFHSGSRQVLTRDGRWVTPELLAILDDKSRLCCHGQWYLAETAENSTHGLVQGLLKRGLPRALMTDNGPPFIAVEFEQGLRDLGIIHELTLPYSAYQNAKQEVFWVPVETRLLAMLEGVEELTLQLLNDATQAWIELEYNRSVHSEIGTLPLECFRSAKSVLRDSPSVDALRQAFRIKASRSQRRSDGTVSLEGVRFEIPNRFRHIERLELRYARWDLSSADLVDERSGALLATIFPLNKLANADGRRRHLEPAGPTPAPPPSEMAPLLKKLLADYAAAGVPPAYIPKEDLR
ncbi:MAG: transposase family protein [Armatimonadetes bacterium]|nr:transposase family protein [Armatimonadota bacterium]